MNEFEIIFAIGFLLTGFIVGYPLRHVFGKREAERKFYQIGSVSRRMPPVIQNCRNRLSKDILDAEYLEVRER